MVSFGLSNAPIAFMDMMNLVFWQFLDLFIIIFTNDTLVYCKSTKDSANYLRVVL